MQPVYLDYQATTPLDPRVGSMMRPYWEEHFGNPHSDGHAYGWQARDAVEQARAEVAALINADDDEVVFTSGATESCNLALRGLCDAGDVGERGGRRRAVTVETEHPAVLETAQDLEQRGSLELQWLQVDEAGLIDLERLEQAVDEQTLWVSVMAANNEIGVIQPLEEIADLCRRCGALFHTDATQALGRMPVDVEQWGVDLLSLSAHKIYGPKGVGALYVRRRAGPPLRPLQTGGGQERGLRAGTVPTPLAIGLGEACRLLGEELKTEVERVDELTQRLLRELRSEHPGLRLFGDAERRIPGNLNIGFPGVSADSLVSAVSSRVAISTGSACASVGTEPSHVLLALTGSAETATTGVRISLGRFTTPQEVETACAVLCEAAHALKGSASFQ